MTKVFIPSVGPQDWQKFLADPEKQWKAGYSAYELAVAWERACGRFPAEVENILSAGTNEKFKGLEILVAFPEWKVNLPPRGHPSQNDLFVIAKGKDGLVVIMVEGKVSEPFGEHLVEWLNPPTPGRLKRLAFIQSKLGLEGDLPTDVRYQLLHRTVSAVVEAERFQANSAIMLVHSFSPECLWFEDYAKFLELFGVRSVVPGHLYFLTKLNNLSLYTGWAKGNPAQVIELTSLS